MWLDTEVPSDINNFFSLSIPSLLRNFLYIQWTLQWHTFRGEICLATYPVPSILTPISSGSTRITCSLQLYRVHQQRTYDAVAEYFSLGLMASGHFALIIKEWCRLALHLVYMILI